MQGYSSDKTRQRSRALVPVSRSLQPASAGLRGVALDGPVPPQPPRRGVLGLGIKIVGGVVAACAILLAGANLLAPSAWVEARAIDWLKTHMGYDLAVNGTTRLSFRPLPHIEMTEVVVAEPNAAPGAPELAIPRLEISLGLFDVLGAPTSIERVVMDRPVLALHADGQEQAGLPLTMAGLGPDGADEAHRLAVEELQINDGTVLVHSARRAVPRRFDRVNADLSIPALTAPANGRGQLNWKGKTIGFRFKLTTPADLAKQKTAQLRLAVEADTASVRYEGDIATAPRLSGEGTLAAKTRSVRQFFAWLKGVSGAVPVTGDGEMTSAVAWNGDEIALNEIRFAQEYARGEGHAQIVLSDVRPRLEGAFVVDELNLSPVVALLGTMAPPGAGAVSPPLSLAYAAPSEHKADRAAPPVEPSIQVEQAVVPPPAPSNTGDPRLLIPGPGVSQPSLTISMPQTEIDQVLAMASPPGSTEPLFDADIDLDIRKARLDGVQIGPSAVSLDFTDGTLKAELWQVAFYGGDGRGAMTIAVTDPIPSFDGDIRLEDVDTRSLLKDALGVDRVGGTGRLTLNLSGRSGNWESMALSLMGNGAFAIAEGAIDGVDPSALVQELESGTLDLRKEPDAAMPFSLLAGSFAINHGLASTSNLRLQSPSATITADGVVNLPRDSLDLMLKPGPVAKEQGGGVVSTAEHLAPLRIAGPIASPRIGSAANPLVAGTEGSTPGIVIPGIVLRERRGIRRGNDLTGGVAAGQTQQPSALAPSFSVAPAEDDGSPPLRMESLR